VPLEVRTFPEVPGATNLTAEVPLPIMTFSAVNVLAAVPPRATPSVPEVIPAAFMAVTGMLIFPEPSKDVAVPVTLPDIAIVLAV
jgi:hypothetical protein